MQFSMEIPGQFFQPINLGFYVLSQLIYVLFIVFITCFDVLLPKNIKNLVFIRYIYNIDNHKYFNERYC